MPGDDFELAAVFEQLGETLLHERQRCVAERGGDLLLDLAARVPFLAAKDVDQPLGEPLVGRVIDSRERRDDPVARISDSNERAGEHWELGSTAGGIVSA